MSASGNLNARCLKNGMGLKKNEASKKQIFKASIQKIEGSKKTYSFFLRWCNVLALLCNYQILWSLNLPVLQASPLVPWSLGPLVLWSLGPFVLWSLGPRVPWSSGLLVPWSFRPLVALVPYNLQHFEDNP